VKFQLKKNVATARKNWLLLFFLFATHAGLSQQWDSLNLLLSTDTLLQKSIQKADSITNSFQSKADSLNAVYQSQLSKIDQASSRIQAKIDSLNHLKLPTESLTKKLDSLVSIKHEKMQALTKKIEDLKSRATKDLNALPLPPQLQEPLQKLQASINSYQLPTLSTSGNSLPSWELPSFGNTKLPTLSSQLNLDTNFGGISDNLGKLTDISSKAGDYTQDAQSMVKGNLSEVKSIDKTVETKLSGADELKQLKEGTALLESNKLDSAAMVDMAKEQVLNAAKDHFAGKEEILQQAMDKMAKLKTRYAEVASSADLPKRLPNPLKGKPFIERIVPGITFQIQQEDFFLLDVNPMVMYRWYPRWSLGVGWNQRLPFDGLQVQKEGSVYGPRAAIEFKWAKGFNLKLMPELMNTTIPALAAQSRGVDPAYREWVPALFAGIKKEFKIYRGLKGNSEILYNLYDKDHLSPYGDKISVRFGFELEIRKKPAATQSKE